MNNQKTMFAIIAIVVVMSVAAIAPAMMNTAMAKSNHFSKSGNPHNSPGSKDTGDPHKDHKTGNPHFCPDSQC
jgi:hypothetical protein